jgi:Skp family chaperone for outer membrane proteins
MNTNSRKTWIALALTLLAIAPAALAQNATEEGAADAASAEAQAAPAAAREGSDQLAAIKQTDEELMSISSEAPEAEGEDLEILRVRFAELAPQQVAALTALLDLTGERRKSGADVAYLEQQIAPLLGRTSRRLRTYIDQLAADLLDRAATRPDLAVTEVTGFEHRMAVDTDRLDHLFLELITLTTEMEAAAYPVDDERAFLESRLTARGEHLLKIVGAAEQQLEEIREALDRAPDDTELQTRRFARE